ncbi:J domain-containing protein [Glaciibacter flavus]|uniref:J domain-containing protein n=1 Tax=Orlajensenia flava TaxID=2565934 RepID=UPI003B0054E7
MSLDQAAAVLGVSPSATDAQIRAAYRARARAAHPDRFADGTARQRAEASERFILVGRAYDELSRHPARRGGGPTPPPATPMPRPADSSPASGANDGAVFGSGIPRPAPVLSARARSFWRWTAIIVAALLALLFSSNSVGLSPGNFGVSIESPWYLPLMIAAELLCLLACVACAVFAATGRLLVAAALLSGLVLLGFFVASLLLAPFTVSSLFFAAFGTALTASPFVALLLMGRAQRDRVALGGD